MYVKGYVQMIKYCLIVICILIWGIVFVIFSYLVVQGCNIIDFSQFDDIEIGCFFMCVSFVFESGVMLEILCEGMFVVVEGFDMDWVFYDEVEKMKVVIMVSCFGYCLNDLFYCWCIGVLLIDIVVVILNYMDYQKVVVNYDIFFYMIWVIKENKFEVEVQLMCVVEDLGVEFVVLVCYMQVLLDDLCCKMLGWIINIYYLFLLLFKGVNFYKQVYECGVKLIGVISYYVIVDLDEGLIIEQDIICVIYV